jgi:dimethylargininase
MTPASYTASRLPSTAAGLPPEPDGLSKRTDHSFFAPATDRLEGIAAAQNGGLDGGDVLQAGHAVYAGRGRRTNGAGIRQLRALLAPLGRTVIAVPLSGVLHLKSAVTVLPDGTFLLQPQLVPAGLFPAVRPVEEESGCHVVPLGADRVLIAASAPRTAELLDDMGFTPVVVDISEFEKLEGCVTCLSVLLPRQ